MTKSKNKKRNFLNFYFLGRNEDELITKATRKLKEFSKRNSLPASISANVDVLKEPLDEKLIKDITGNFISTLSKFHVLVCFVVVSSGILFFLLLCTWVTSSSLSNVRYVLLYYSDSGNSSLETTLFWFTFDLSCQVSSLVLLLVSQVTFPPVSGSVSSSFSLKLWWC